jgi:CBS domain-containing protein
MHYKVLQVYRNKSFGMKAYDVMSVDIVVVKEDAKAIEISTRIALEGYNGMPIINETGAVIGIVTTLDILKAIKDNKDLDKLSAKDIMTRHPSTLGQDASTDEIIDIMYRKYLSLQMKRMTVGLSESFPDRIF